MAKLLKLRRGTTSEHSSFTGAEGEVTVDTTKDTVVVHDGTTAGGTPLATESALNSVNTDLSNDTSPQLGGSLDVNGKNIILGDSSDADTNDVIKFGDGTDLKIYSDGTNGKFIGNIDIEGTLQFSDGSAADAMVWDQSTNNLEFKDGNKLTFGNGNDLQIWHEDTVGSHINNSHLKLYIDSYTGVVLEHNTAAKLETTANGVTVTGNVVATGFTGTASQASTVNVTAQNNTAATVYPLFAGNGSTATGYLNPSTDTGFTYNSSTGNLTSTVFTGDLTGNVTGNTSGSSGSCTGNAATATTATNVTVADETTDTSCNVVFTTAATGDLAPKSNAKLTFDSATGTLNADILTQKIGGVQWDVKDVYWGGTNGNMNHNSSLKGRCMGIYGTTPIVGGGWTAGNTLTLINTTSSNASITQSGCTLYWTADGTSGTRTLGPRGMCTLYWVSSTVAYIGGGGLS